MKLISEKVPQDQWEYFNSLNIQFEGKHITADKYSTWVIDWERGIVFTMVQTPGRDYGATYILIWRTDRVYFEVESHSEWHSGEGVNKYHWNIKRVIAPNTLKTKQEELEELIMKVSEIGSDHRRDSIFVIDNIDVPRFVEEV